MMRTITTYSKRAPFIMRLSSTGLVFAEWQLGKKCVDVPLRGCDKSVNKLEGLTFAVVNLADCAVIEGKDLGTGICQQDWRVRSDHELNVVVALQQVMEKYQKT